MSTGEKGSSQDHLETKEGTNVNNIKTKDDAMLNSPHLDTILSMSPEERAEVERKLLKKIDMRLIPWMT
jgi:hypothetical protein